MMWATRTKPEITQSLGHYDNHPLAQSVVSYDRGKQRSRRSAPSVTIYNMYDIHQRRTQSISHHILSWMMTFSACTPPHIRHGLTTTLAQRFLIWRKVTQRVLVYVRDDDNNLQYCRSSLRRCYWLPRSRSSVTKADLYYHTVECHPTENNTELPSRLWILRPHLEWTT